MRVHYGPALLRRGPGARAAAPMGGGVSFLPQGYGAAPTLRAADPATLHTLRGEAMGTTWSVRLANPRFLPLEQVRAAIEEALALVVRQMSNWEQDSDISRFNRAEPGTWQALPPECFAVLSCALGWARESGGAWDPTVGPLVDLWGFGPAGHAAQVPDAGAMARAQARVGHARIALRPAERLALQPGGAQVDLCGIAKGYSVDLVADALQALGLADFLVEVGGELRARGRRPDGQPWRVAVAGIAREGAPPRTLVLQDMAIATSGDTGTPSTRAGAATHTPSIPAPARPWPMRWPASPCCTPSACRPTRWPPCLPCWGRARAWRSPRRAAWPRCCASARRRACRWR
jgi:thiamine biosynthesis lipoprotein